MIDRTDRTPQITLKSCYLVHYYDYHRTLKNIKASFENDKAKNKLIHRNEFSVTQNNIICTTNLILLTLIKIIFYVVLKN